MSRGSLFGLIQGIISAILSDLGNVLLDITWLTRLSNGESSVVWFVFIVLI